MNYSLVDLLLVNTVILGTLGYMVALETYTNSKSEKEFENLRNELSKGRFGSIDKRLFDICFWGYHLGNYIKQRKKTPPIEI